MLSVEYLQDLCKQALKEQKLQNIERLSQIKQLTQSLLTQSFEADDDKSYAQVIKTILEFVQQTKDNRIDFLASIFEIEYDEIDVTRSLLDANNEGLIRNIVQHHDLLKHPEKLKRDPKQIQPFLSRVTGLLGIDSKKPLTPTPVLTKEIATSYEANDLQQLQLFSQLFDLNIQQAFQNNDPNRVAELLKGVLPSIEKALRLGQYELFVSLFKLDQEEIEDLHACAHSRAKNLINWLLVDHLELEKYAKEMPIERSDVQAFKQVVLTNLRTPKPLKTPVQLATEFEHTLTRQDEIVLDRISVEGECLEKQLFLDNNIPEFAVYLDVLYEQVKAAFENEDYATIAKFLDIGSKDLEELIVLLETGDESAVRYFLIQNEELDEIAFKYSTSVNGKDAIRTTEFRNSAYAHFSTTKRLTANVTEISELITKVLTNPTSDQLHYLEIKVSQALQNAYQQNDLEEYLAIINKVVEVYATLLVEDPATILLTLDLPKDKREALLYYLQEKEFNKCAVIILEDDINFHKAFHYSQHEILQDFQQRAFEKLNLETIPTVDSQIKKEDPGHFESVDFIEYWSSKVLSITPFFQAKEILAFREQVKQRLQKCFKENDVKGYSDTIQLLRNYRDECLTYNNITSFSILFAIDPDDISTTISLINSENKPFLEWLTVQQHELNDVCLRGEKKYSEIGPFINKVFSTLQIKPKACFRDRSIISNDLKQAINENDNDKIKYYSEELEGLLKQAIYTNDHLNAARTIDEIMALAQHAFETGHLDKVCSAFELLNDDIETVNQCFEQGRIDLLKLAYINDYRLEETIRHTGDSAFKSKLRTQLENTVQLQGTQVFSSISRLENLITDALNSNDEKSLKLLSFECELMVKHAFLNNDHALFAELNKLFSRLTHLAVALRRSDLIIKHFDIDSGHIELIQLIQKNPEIAFDKQSFEKLMHFAIIQSHELELYGQLFGIESDDVQNFKRQAHTTIMEQPNGLLLCPQAWIVEQGEAMIQQANTPHLTKQLWDAHVDAHVEFAFEDADHEHFANIVTMLNQLIHNAFQSGKLELLLSNIDFTMKERDALFHHLQHKNKVGSAQVLTEVLFRIKAENFRDKLGYRYKPEFRIKIYEQLGIPTPELSFMDNRKENPGIRPLHGDIAGFENLTWLRNKGTQIDSNDPFTLNILKSLAMHDLADSAIVYLEILNTPDSKKAAEFLKAFRLERQLCHRLGLTGDRTVQGVSLRVEGGFESDMARELTAFEHYFLFSEPNKFDTILQNIYQQPVNSIAIVKAIQADLNAINLRQNAETVTDALIQNQVVNIPVSLKTTEDPLFETKFGYHYENCTLFDNFCLLADRSRSGEQAQGIRICKITKPENLPKIANELGASSSDLMTVDTGQFDNYMTESLGLVDCGFMPFPAQTAGSCAWTSCAEMMLPSTVFARLYQFGRQQGLTEENAIAKAQEGAMRFHNLLMAENVRQLVATYLQFKASTTLALDPKTLALTFLRCEHDPHYQSIAKMIKDANVVSKNDLADAYAHLLNDVAEMVPIPMRQQATDKGITKQMLDFALEGNLQAANDCYKAFAISLSAGPSSSEPQASKPVKRQSLTYAKNENKSQKAKEKDDSKPTKRGKDKPGIKP